MKELKDRRINYNFIFLAQHYETIYEILDDFHLKKPDIVLGGTQKDIVSSLKLFLWAVNVFFTSVFRKKKIFQGDNNGVVLVHGDALPLFLGALLGKIQRLKVGAVEAGLRSHNYRNPFPEELIRVITSRLGLIDIFYCQDSISVNNAEEYKKGRVVCTQGNTIFDSIDLALKNNVPEKKIPNKYAIVTLHRFENISTRDKFKKILDLVLSPPDGVKLKFILHPPTRKKLREYALYEYVEKMDRVELLPRMNFLNFNRLLSRAQYIITDGGSNQEECAYMGVPCLIMRSETERSDGIGRNAVLSLYDEEIIQNFFQNYETLRQAPETASASPTKIIVDDLLAAL